MNPVSPAAPLSNRTEDEINPCAADVMAPSQNGSTGSYVPPPPGTSGSGAAPSSTSGMRQNLLSSTPSPPVSEQIMVPGAINPNRSPSPAVMRTYNRGTPTPPPHLTPAGTDQGAGSSSADMNLAKQLEQLQQKMKERDEELGQMRKRENWLVTEVVLARQVNGVGDQQLDPQQKAQLDGKRLSMADLENEIANCQLEGQQVKVAKVLLKVKEELRNTKMSIATQAQAASIKIKEAERIRTGALQEAAYLKAKLSSMSNTQQDPGALARVETERAMDLEKRLTLALSEIELLESQYTKTQEGLQQEKLARLSSEERSNGASILAEQAQTAHTRALAELATLHGRATKAEEESREYATQLAESQAGFSGHQSQSTGLLQKITDLKQQIEERETALERVQMAYTVANGRATRAEALCDESSGKLGKLESQRSELSSELTRFKGETERLQSKVEDLESRWQVSKDEVVTLRKLVEDGLGAFNPRGKSQQSVARKHDSIAILNTVSKISELEHELSSLKVLHKNTQVSASKSAADLADAMMEISRLEQSSMKTRAESISLQRQLAEDREINAGLRSELGKTEQDLENNIKELENNEVQLGLLKDVMREKGILAEDVMLQAVGRGSGDHATSME
ncbi:Negative regulator of mitotic exit, partial [Modicella reniformis]